MVCTCTPAGDSRGIKTGYCIRALAVLFAVSGCSKGISKDVTECVRAVQYQCDSTTWYLL